MLSEFGGAFVFGRQEAAVKHFLGCGRALQLVDVVIHPNETVQVLPHDGWDAALVDDAARLAFSLVRANGQMDFIRRQSWFKDGSYRVVLHVITQWGRNIAPLEFHKDSKGEELFSKLVFRHDQVIPATEWSVDLENMPAEKIERFEDCWPPTLLADIEQVRANLEAPVGGMFHIEGGKLQPDSYMSWVDPLVWHSTPSLDHRPRYSLDDARKVLADPAFSLRTYDILVQLARLPNGHFARYLAEHDMPVEELNGETVGQLFGWRHTDEDFAFLGDAWLEDASAINWSDRPHDTGAGVAMIRVNAASPHQVQLIQATGLETRPRSNSHNLKELQARSRPGCPGRLFCARRSATQASWRRRRPTGSMCSNWRYLVTVRRATTSPC